MPVLAQAATAESRIFNEIAAILLRQRTEPVERQLEELKAQLERIYNGPNKRNVDLATCQMGIAMTSFGLGDHAEALRLAINASTIGPYEVHVVMNGLALFINMGEFELARKAAVEASKRFPGDLEPILAASLVLSESLDFGAAVECMDQALKLLPAEPMLSALNQRMKFLQDMAAESAVLRLTSGDWQDRATCAVAVLREAGHKLYWTELSGQRLGAVSLQFFVDASAEECSTLNFSIADALTQKFEETGVDLLTMVARSYEGIQAARAANVVALAS